MSDSQPDESEQRTGETTEDWARRNREAADKRVAAGEEPDKDVVLDRGEFVETANPGAGAEPEPTEDDEPQ